MPVTVIGKLKTAIRTLETAIGGLEMTIRTPEAASRWAPAPDIHKKDTGQNRTIAPFCPVLLFTPCTAVTPLQGITIRLGKKLTSLNTMLPVQQAAASDRYADSPDPKAGSRVTAQDIIQTCSLWC